MRGPSRMPYPNIARHVIKVKSIMDLIDLALILLQVYLALLDCHLACRVVSTILESLKALMNDRRDIAFFENASEYPAQKRPTPTV